MVISFGIRVGTGSNLKFDMFLIISRFKGKLLLRLEGGNGMCNGLRGLQVKTVTRVTS